MKFLKFLLALILFPITCLVVWEDLRILLGVLEHLSAAVSFFLGAVIYSAIHYKYYRFSRLYVLAHEMTHAIAAVLCGIRIKEISIGKDSGYVKMDRTNTFVVLAPYFVPGYVVLVALAYWVGGEWVDLTPYRQIVLFLIGFFMAFHLIQTFHTLWEADQPDLKLAGGKIFSLVTIVLVNLIVLACVLKVLFPQEVHLSQAALHVLRGTLNIWRIIVNYIVEQIINAI